MLASAAKHVIVKAVRKRGLGNRERDARGVLIIGKQNCDTMVGLDKGVRIIWWRWLVQWRAFVVISMETLSAKALSSFFCYKSSFQWVWELGIVIGLLYSIYD